MSIKFEIPAALTYFCYLDPMEKWREEFEDIPDPNVEIYLVLRKYFLQTSEYPGSGHAGDSTSFLLPHIVDVKNGKGLLASKDAAKNKKTLLEYCRNVIDLERDINKNTAIDGGNLWINPAITTNDGERIIWQAEHTLHWHDKDYEESLSLFQKITDPEQNCLLFHAKRPLTDCNDSWKIFADQNHLFFAHYEDEHEDSAVRHCHRVSRPVLTKLGAEARFRTDMIRRYLKTSLAI